MVTPWLGGVFGGGRSSGGGGGGNCIIRMIVGSFHIGELYDPVRFVPEAFGVNAPDGGGGSGGVHI